MEDLRCDLTAMGESLSFQKLCEMSPLVEVEVYVFAYI